VTTGRLVALGATGIVVFLGGSLLLVDWLTSDPSSSRSSAVIDPADTARMQAAQAYAEAMANKPVAGMDGVGLKPQYEMGVAPPPPTRGSWEAVKIAPRAAALGKVGVALNQDLNELHPALSECIGEESQARHGASAVSAVQDAQPQDDSGVPVLVLQLETMNGAIRIVDAPVESRGRASVGQLACIQSKLRGHVVDAPGTAGGERYRLLYTILP
jgi:hypothetical protein